MLLVGFITLSLVKTTSIVLFLLPFIFFNEPKEFHLICAATYFIFFSSAVVEQSHKKSVANLLATGNLYVFLLLLPRTFPQSLVFHSIARFP